MINAISKPVSMLSLFRKVNVDPCEGSSLHIAVLMRGILAAESAAARERLRAGSERGHGGADADRAALLGALALPAGGHRGRRL